MTNKTKHNTLNKLPTGKLRTIAFLLFTFSFFLCTTCAGTGGTRGTASAGTAAQDVEVFVQLGHSSGVTSVVFSPSGTQALSGSRDGMLKLWDVETGREIRTFSGHSHNVWSVEFSPDGQ